MPLSPPSADRLELHHRRLDFRGYRRADGLFDIEGTLLDTKGIDVPLLGTGRVVAAGEAMHRMSIRITVSADLEILAIEAASDATPYDVCPEAVASLQTVVGMKIGAGWTYAIKRRFVGAASCTHLAEMLIALGTAAYQAVVPYNRLHGRETDGFALEKKADSCYAYASERPLMQQLKGDATLSPKVASPIRFDTNAKG